MENGIKWERRRNKDLMLKSKSSWHTVLLLVFLTLIKAWHLGALMGMVAKSGRKSH